jgi:serine/threonine-protein kinase
VPPGTLAYQSPRLLASHLPKGTPYRAQPTDDWYALGVLLYEVLTEVPPYPRSDEAQELAYWVRRCKPVAPHELNPRVPPALSQVVLTLLSAEPHLRYQNGQALCAALEQALATASEPEAPLWPPLPPPERTPTQPPSASDGPPAQDEQVRNAHAMKDEEDPEKERLAQVEIQRDLLLQSRRQRRPPPLWSWAARVARQPWARGVAASVLLAALALAAWAVGRPTVTRQAPSMLPPTSQAPAPVAASGASPPLGPLDSSPPKEDSPVKKTQSPVATPSTTPAAERSKANKSSAAKAVMCLGLITTGCTSVPLRPTQQQCPPAAVAALKQRGWTTIFLNLDPNKHGGDDVQLRPGPILSKSRGGFGSTPPPEGSLLHGHVFVAEDGRVVVRYIEVELESGERVPICHAVVDMDSTVNLDRQTNLTENSVDAHNSQVANFFRVLPD